MNPIETYILHEILDGMLKKHLIRMSLSTCVVPTLLVPKKDGSNRICVDGKDINKITMKYCFLIRRIEDMFVKLGGA